MSQSPDEDPRIAEQAVKALQRAEGYLSRGDYQVALDRYSQISIRYSQSEWAATALWKVYAIQQVLSNSEGAFEALDRLAVQQPGHFERAQQKQLELAKNLLEANTESPRSLEVKPKSERVRKSVITAMFERIVVNGPYSDAGIDASHYLALAIERDGEVARAAELHETFIERHPEHELADDSAFQVAYIRYKKWKGMRGESPRYREAAAVALAFFLAAYPESSKVAEARSCLAEVKTSEYRELLQLAEFYEEKGQGSSASVYYRLIGERFPDIVVRSPQLKAKIHEATSKSDRSGQRSGNRVGPDGAEKARSLEAEGDDNIN